jgi:hypothetical protein
MDTKMYCMQQEEEKKKLIANKKSANFQNK